MLIELDLTRGQREMPVTARQAARGEEAADEPIAARAQDRDTNSNNKPSMN